MEQNMNLRRNIYVDSTVTIQQIATAMPRDLPYLHSFPDLKETIVEREEDAKQLLKLVTEHRNVVITGIGGIGKTTLATLCAIEWVKQTEFKYAVFINMETATSAEKVYHALSEHIFNKRIYSDNTIYEVYEYYNKNKSLFVLDNIEDNDLLPIYLPPKELTNIYVLGTSQFKELTTLFKLFPLGTLPYNASFDLIKKIFTENDIQIDSEITQRMDNIIKMLDNHPLALQHAAAFIIDTVRYDNMTPLKSLDEYINQINQQLQKPPPAGLPSKYRRSVLTSIEMNITKATKNDDARALLFCMAYLDPSEIDITMFYNYPNFNEVNIKKYLRDLSRYSIITEHNCKLNVISIHRLITTVCHVLIKEDKKTNYISTLFNIFLYYEDCKYTTNPLENHFNSLIHHAKIPNDKLSELYIESFTKHDKIMNKLGERLKLISCGKSDIKDWTILQYCVFAGHETLFEYFKKTIKEDINEDIFYNVQVIKNSTIELFDRRFSLIQSLENPLLAHRRYEHEEKDERGIKGLTLLHFCAAYGVNINGFNALLQNVYDQNKTDNNGMTPILWAAKNLVYDIVFALHRNGAKYDPKYKKLLSAASSGDFELVHKLFRAREVNYASSVFGKMLLWWGVNHLNLTQELIKQGVDVTGADARGNTLLHLAAQHGNYNLASKLIRESASVKAVNAFGKTPLLLAARYGHSDIVTELIRANANIQVGHTSGETPLLAAAEHGHSDIVTKLIRAGASVEAVDASGKTPLLLAAKNGHNDIVTELIRVSANVQAVDASGETPLLAACWRFGGLAAGKHGHSDIAAKLIRAGANVEAIGASNETPLLKAARHGHSDIVTKLIDAGANIEAVGVSGETPLLNAAKYGRTDIAAKLILAGANIEAVGASGETPLLKAARYGRNDFATELICKGAKVNVVDKLGRTPLSWAKQKKNLILEEELIKHGATN